MENVIFLFNAECGSYKNRALHYVTLKQEPINRSLYLHYFLESTLSRVHVALFLERLSGEVSHAHSSTR